MAKSVKPDRPLRDSAIAKASRTISNPHQPRWANPIALNRKKGNY
ncbi:MAG: hypothetical protein AAGA60_20275 [Cyanobacteria bacterium P01_E01_bin.42]